MQDKSKHIVIGITGASGSVYAQKLVDTLIDLSKVHNIKLSVVISKDAEAVVTHELGKEIDLPEGVFKYENSDFNAPFASGSSVADVLVVVPCSVSSLGKIANGVSDNLICRAADVVLKERKKLILVTRETPLSYIHVTNMQTITLAGGIILPASPSYYLKPRTVEDLVMSVVNRIVDQIGYSREIDRW